MFGLVAAGLLALRRGPFGRRLSALRDSPLACTTMGLDTTATKLQVFALSSAIAGLGGVLLAGLRQTATAGDYTMFSSLPLVLLAVLGGITAVSGALVGGLVLAGFPVLADKVSWLEASPSSAPDSSASRWPAGPTGSCCRRRTCGRVAGALGPRASTSSPAHVEELGLTIPFEPGHRAAVDHHLAVDA